MEDDAALVHAARSGDRAAYARLATRHRGTVVGLCRRMLDDPGLAEDAAQEAILAGMLDLDRLRDPASFGAWLAGIGLNVCRRWLRHWRPPHCAAELGAEADPAAAAETAEVAQRVRAAVAGLPPGQRAAVAGFYLRELTQAEVATALGIGVGAVKARLHKARAALRTQLADLREEPAMPASADLVAVRVADVHLLPPGEGEEFHCHVVVLAEVDGDRRLPIWIGPPEAAALAFTLQSVEMPRPLTFRFAADLIAASGGRVTGCRITRLVGETFYAEVLVDGAGGQRVVDARPSDAMNLALVVDAPLFVDGALLDRDPDIELPPEEGVVAVAEYYISRRPRVGLSETPPTPAE